MKRLILLIALLLVTVSAYAAQVVTPAPPGTGTWASLVDAATQVFAGPIEAGGTFSKIIFNNNLIDNSDDELGLRIVDGVLYAKNGTDLIPLQRVDGGINGGLATIYNPEYTTTKVFGETLATPITVNNSAPSVFPVLPITAVETDVWVAGLAYQHYGTAVDWDETGYYTATAISTSSGEKFTLNSGGYLTSSVINEDATNRININHTGAALPKVIEFAGKIDCSGSSSGGTQGIAAVSLIGKWTTFPAIGLVNIGWDTFQSASNYWVKIVNENEATTIAISSGEMSYRIVLTYVDATHIGYDIYLNGALLVSDPNYTANIDMSIMTDFYYSARVDGDATFTGTADMKDYGYFVSYDQTP